MRNRWDMLGGRLGIAYCIAGFVLIFLGWNGAASYNRSFEQTPYLVSGGIAGLGLIVLGAALIVAQSLRHDRVELRGSIDDLRAAVQQLADGGGGVGPVVRTGGGTGGDTVVASSASYHRPTCRLIQGQAGMTTMTAAEAAAGDLDPCRICDPDSDTPLRAADAS